jgi:hypothetical protein
MDIFYLKTLSFGILLVSLLLVSGFPKIFIFTLPIVAGLFHYCFPDWRAVQIATWSIWALHTWGNWRISAVSEDGMKLWGPPLIVLIVLAVAGAWLISARLGWSQEATTLWKGILHIFGLSLLLGYLLYLVLRGVIVPLLVRNRMPVTAPLVDYYMAPARRKEWFGHPLIRFGDDGTWYETGLLSFRRYKRKVGVPYSYVKCECLFGFTCLRRIRPLLSDVAGKPSSWDVSPETRKQRRQTRAVVLLLLISFAFLGITMFLVCVL